MIVCVCMCFCQYFYYFVIVAFIESERRFRLAYNCFRGGVCCVCVCVYAGVSRRDIVMVVHNSEWQHRRVLVSLAHVPTDNVYRAEGTCDASYTYFTDIFFLLLSLYKFKNTHFVYRVLPCWLMTARWLQWMPQNAVLCLSTRFFLYSLFSLLLIKHRAHTSLPFHWMLRGRKDEWERRRRANCGEWRVHGIRATTTR